MTISQFNSYIASTFNASATNISASTLATAFTNLSGIVNAISLTAGVPGPQGPTGATGATGPQGPAGTNGTNASTIVQIVSGPIGPQGIQGAQGIQGQAGTNGTNGLNVYSGSGVPSNSFGIAGESYIDYIAGNLYTKISGAWVNQRSLIGLTGATGQTGPAGTYTPGNASNQALVWNGSTYQPRQLGLADIAGGTLSGSLVVTGSIQANSEIITGNITSSSIISVNINGVTPNNFSSISVTAPNDNNTYSALGITKTSNLAYNFGIDANNNLIIASGSNAVNNYFTITNIPLFSLSNSGNLSIYGTMQVGTFSFDPAPANGKIYYNSALNSFRKCVNGTWSSF